MRVVQREDITTGADRCGCYTAYVNTAETSELRCDGRLVIISHIKELQVK